MNTAPAVNNAEANETSAMNKVVAGNAQAKQNPLLTAAVTGTAEAIMSSFIVLGSEELWSDEVMKCDCLLVFVVFLGKVMKFSNYCSIFVKTTYHTLEEK
jgi:hypothetical protein